MDDRDALTHVRSIMTRVDHTELVTALRYQPWPRDSLELIGDGLLAAVREGTKGLGEPCPRVRHCPSGAGMGGRP
jgi:hypothetical protein